MTEFTFRKATGKEMNSKELEPLAEKALWMLRNDAAAHGQARANADYMDAFVKSELARIKSTMVFADSDAAKTMEAMKSEAYRSVLEAKKEADTAHYTNMFKREAAMAVIEAWRTVCSNERAAP